jgi:hypothetical protein
LAAQPRLALLDVIREPLVLFPRRILPSVFDALFGLYHAAGSAPRVAQEAIQMQTIVNLVSAGLGMAWVPRSVQRFERPGVVYRPVDPQAGGAVPECETSLVWLRDNASPVLQRFVEFAQAQSRRSMTGLKPCFHATRLEGALQGADEHHHLLCRQIGEMLAQHHRHMVHQRPAGNAFVGVQERQAQRVGLFEHHAQGGVLAAVLGGACGAVHFA